MRVGQYFMTFFVFSLLACSSKSRNPAVPKGPTDTMMRIESALVEVKQDIDRKPFRGVSDNMVTDHTHGLAATAKGTPWESDAQALHDAAQKFAKLCNDRKTPQKKLQDECAALEAKIQAIKEKFK